MPPSQIVRVTAERAEWPAPAENLVAPCLLRHAATMDLLKNA